MTTMTPITEEERKKVQADLDAFTEELRKAMEAQQNELVRKGELDEFWEELQTLADTYGVKALFSSRYDNDDGAGEFHTWDFFTDYKEVL